MFVRSNTDSLHVFQGADILVFPEDGIYGPLWLGSRSRDFIFPFLEYIPDAAARWNPCTDPGRFPSSDVQVFLSCMARNYSLYVVANFGDMQRCNNTDPHCPGDSRYQFNTDIVYDPQGNFIAKYHKYHLFSESEFDKPSAPEIGTFDTPFGKFGLITCFDVLFQHPAVDLIKKFGIANIAFPTAWRDAAPFLTSIEYHSSFAKAFGINFLSANIHEPLFRFHGSGIYTKDGGAAYYYDNRLLSGGKLIVQTIPVVHNPDVPRDRAEVPVEVHSGKDKSFTAEIFHDKHTLVKLSSSEGRASVCNKNLCCNISFELDFQSKALLNESSSEFFALAAFDGLHKDTENYYIQVCSVLRCRSFCDSVTCGEYASHRDGPGSRIRRLQMFGNFSTPYIYPEVLLENGNSVELTPYPNQWTFTGGQLTLNKPSKLPLHVATLFARVYDRDKDG